MEKTNFSFIVNVSALRQAIMNKDKEEITAMFPCLEHDIKKYYSLLENDSLNDSSIRRFNRVIKQVKKGLNELGFSIDALFKE